MGPLSCPLNHVIPRDPVDHTDPGPVFNASLGICGIRFDPIPYKGAELGVVHVMIRCYDVQVELPMISVEFDPRKRFIR